jgi:transcriptional regulator GlxA family with amidase domain
MAEPPIPLMKEEEAMQKKFGFLLFNQFEDLDFFGPWEIIGVWSTQFDGPNERLTISQNGNEVTSTKGLTITPQIDFDHCPALDILLIPGGQGTRTEVDNECLLKFIIKQSQSCQQILSVCTGSFLLQAAGLLDGKKATTHHASLDRLRAFEKVTVCDDKRFVQDGNLWTSAGISAGIDMTFAYIASMTNEETAGDIQLFTEYYPSTKIYKTQHPLPEYTRIE